MMFATLNAAERYREDNEAYLSSILSESDSTPGVSYSEVWLNGRSPSFIAGYNSEDVQVVSFRI